MKLTCLILFIWTLNSSCSTPDVLKKQDFLAYIQNESNGLIQISKKGDYTIQLIYKPKEIIWYDELVDDSNDSLKNQIPRLDYLMLKISKLNQDPTNTLAGSDDFLLAQKYLNGEIGSDISLITSGDTIRPIEYNFTPTYGTIPDASVLFVFDSNLRNQDEDFRILFQDNFFGTGLSTFSFRVDDVKRIPQLKF